MANCFGISRSYLILQLLYAFLYITFTTAAISGSHADFWDSFFSKGVVHQLSTSATEDDLVSNPTGTIVSPSYNNSFRYSPTNHHGVVIRTLGYENIALFYRGDRNRLFGTDTSCNGSSFGRDKYGSAHCVVFIASPVTSASNTNGSDEEPFQIASHSTNHSNIRFIASSESPTSTNLTAFKISYVLFNGMLPNTTASATRDPLPLPTVVYSSDSLRYNNIIAKRLPVTSQVKVNVQLYDSIDITLLANNVRTLTCDQVHMMVNGVQLCSNRTNITEIDVSSKAVIILTYNSVLSYQDIGMLASITGRKKAGWYGICDNDNTLLLDVSGNIYSHNYPYPSSHIVNECKVMIDAFDSISYTYTSSGFAAPNCNVSKLTVAGQTPLCGQRNVAVEDKLADVESELSFSFSQHMNVPAAPFKIAFQIAQYQDICSLNSQNITNLPFNLKSPGFPLANHYSPNANCTLTFRVPGVTAINVTFDSFDLERAPVYRCMHNHLLFVSDQVHLYCGTLVKGHMLSLNISGGLFAVRFLSDSLFDAKGFALKIESNQYQPPPTTTSSTSTSSSTLSTSSTSSTSGTSQTTEANIPSKTTQVQKTTKNGIIVLPIGGKTSKAGKPSGTSPIKSKGTPAYVWVLVSIAICGAIIAVLVITVIIRRRRNPYPRSNNDADDLDIGFENPIYGHRQSERVSFSRDF